METPVKVKYSVALGSISIHIKWKGTKLSADVKAKFNSVCWRDTGCYDFCLSGDRYVIYIPESDLVTNVDPKKFGEINSDDTIIIAVRNTVTADRYSKLQDALVISGNVKMIPVGDSSEIPDILYQLSNATNTPSKTPEPEFTQISLNILMNIPDLGKIKAKRLINAFGTIHKIASSSIYELSSVVGLISAAEVHKYFNRVYNFSDLNN